MEPSALVKKARRAAGISQAELAGRVGVKQPEIARLESPGANPTIATLKRVVAAADHNLVVDLERPFGIDESLIAESLKSSPVERLRQFESFYESARQIGGKAFPAVGS